MLRLAAGDIFSEKVLAIEDQGINIYIYIISLLYFYIFIFLFGIVFCFILHVHPEIFKTNVEDFLKRVKEMDDEGWMFAPTQVPFNQHRYGL